MVKVGDKIKTKNGIGYIKEILKSKDGRYLIIYEIPMLYTLQEGDESYEIIPYKGVV